MLKAVGSPAMLFRCLLLAPPGRFAWWYAAVGAPVAGCDLDALALSRARR
jgi:hypothetical protein